MLRFDNLNIAVSNKQLFTCKSLSLTQGLVALVGRNGSGKSTLLKTIMGAHSLFTGSILIDGQEIGTIENYKIAQKIAVVYSKSTIFGNHTGRDILNLGRLPYQNRFAKLTVKDITAVNEVINLLSLAEFVDRGFQNLSDGERQLVMIGRAMVQDTAIILLDEPGAFLDLVNRHHLMLVLKKIAESSGKLIVFSTHEIDQLATNCDAVALIANEELNLLTDKNSFVKEIHKSFGIEV